MDVSDVRAEYDRLDRLCGVDTSNVEIVVSPRMFATYGNCKYDRAGKPRRITIASVLFSLNEATLLDTIRHEYAHALVRLRFPNERHHHDAVWKAAAVEVGCDPTRCGNDPDFSRNHEKESRKRKAQKYKYIVQCKGCNKSWRYQRRGRVVNAILENRGATCPYCSGRDLSVHGVRLGFGHAFIFPLRRSEVVCLQ